MVVLWRLPVQIPTQVELGGSPSPPPSRCLSATAPVSSVVGFWDFQILSCVFARVKVDRQMKVVCFKWIRQNESPLVHSQWNEDESELTPWSCVTSDHEPLKLTPRLHLLFPSWLLCVGCVWWFIDSVALALCSLQVGGDAMFLGVPEAGLDYPSTNQVCVKICEPCHPCVISGFIHVMYRR